MIKEIWSIICALNVNSHKQRLKNEKGKIKKNKEKMYTHDVAFS